MAKSVKQKPDKQKEDYVQTNIDDLVPAEKLEGLLVEGEVLQTQEKVADENIKETYVKTKKDADNLQLGEDENLKQMQDEAIKLQKKKLDEVEQSVSKQGSKKSKIINIAFFILNIVVVAGILVYQLLKENMKPVDGNFDALSFLIVIAFLALVVISETLACSYLLKQSTGKWRMGLAFKVTQLGRYYDSVTPMAAGGQPFQITYLKTHGTPIHTSLSIPLAKYVFSQIAWVIISFVCLIISWTDSSYGTFVSVASIIGFVLSFIMLFVTLFLSICKTVGRKLVVKTLKLLHKMKIVKNYDKQYEKITKYISDFQDVMKQYAKSPKDFIIMLVLSLARNVFNYCIPFFVVKFFIPDLQGGMFIRLFVMSCLVDLSSSFFPMPGGTGMNEISFSAAFTAVIGNSAYLAWVLIFWRVCSYYFYLLQGVMILSYDFAYGNRKYKWDVVRENLALESEVFKQAQINKFRAERAKRRKSKNKSGLREYL